MVFVDMQAYIILNLAIFIFPVIIYLVIASYALLKRRDSIIGFFFVVGFILLIGQILYGLYYIAYLFYIPITAQMLYDVGVMYTPLVMSIFVVMLFIAILRIPEPKPKEAPIDTKKKSKAKSKKRRTR